MVRVSRGTTPPHCCWNAQNPPGSYSLLYFSLFLVLFFVLSVICTVSFSWDKWNLAMSSLHPKRCLARVALCSKLCCNTTVIAKKFTLKHPVNFALFNLDHTLLCIDSLAFCVAPFRHLWSSSGDVSSRYTFFTYSKFSKSKVSWWCGLEVLLPSPVLSCRNTKTLGKQGRVGEQGTCQ